MPEKEPVVIHCAAFSGLEANKDHGTAILLFELQEHDERIAVVLTQAQLESLYQHILSEGSAGHLAFELRSGTGNLSRIVSPTR